MVQSKSQNAAGKRRIKLWFFIVALFLGWAIYTLVNQMYQKNEVHERLMSLEANKHELQQQLDNLNEQVKLLNDPEYMSQLATKEQGMVKAGEQQIFNK